LYPFKSIKISRKALTKMSSFGQWYEEQKTQENAPAASSSWFGGTGENGEQVLPLFGDTSQYSLGNFRSSMEAQMPQKILGMNYQQRFRVRTQRVCTLQDSRRID
jgi:hypothetical protein